MSKQTQLNLRVLEETKDRWDEAVEQSRQYDSLTHLIKLSVDKELEGEERQTDVGDKEEELLRTEVLPLVRQLQATIGNLEGRFERMETEIRNRGPKYDLEQAVLSVLPEGTDEQIRDQPPGQWAMSAEDVADAVQNQGLDVDEGEVRRTLERLCDKFGFVNQFGSERADPDITGPVYYQSE